MGGLALREVAKYDAQNSVNTFGGFIGAGSPLAGAKILNSVSSGAAENMISYGAEELSRGPMAVFGYGELIIEGVFGVSSLQAPKLLRTIILNSVDIALTESHAKSVYGDNTFNDLKEGSSYLSGINSFAGPYKQRLYIMGNESSPVHWRLASSMKRANLDSAWNTNDDLRYVSVANSYRSHYHNMTNIHASWAAMDYMALNFVGGVINSWKSKQWQRGRDWLDMSESYWAGLIGAHGTTYYAGTIDTYEDQCDMPQFEECFGNGEDPVTVDCEDCTVVPVTLPVWIPTQTGSDGLVAVYSQLAEGTPWSVSSDRIYEAVNVNHMEMRGHTNMAVQLNNCFDRGDFFRTPGW